MANTDQETDRGARIIRRAVQMMKLGLARGWSDALAKARAEIRV